ncbi:MAG: ferrous iron transport protein B [Solobacterium sp.]|nr:ferrous iron transport protein B [Solobacterium sp.]
MSESMTIALLGQPNSGKSTFYNALTGARQHVGNWPGKTVEQCIGSFTANGKTYTVVDLPGTYSLAANSDEEIVTRDYIASGEADLICLLTDSSQLERSLFMCADYTGIRVPAVLLLNMMDVAGMQGKTVDPAVIEKKLGIPVLPFVASDKTNYSSFYELLKNAEHRNAVISSADLAKRYEEAFGETYRTVVSLLPENGISVYEPCWLFAKLAEHDPAAEKLVEGAVSAENFQRIQEALRPVEDGSSRTGSCKFAWIDYLLDGAVKTVAPDKAANTFDRIAISKRWGKPVAAGIILLSLVVSILAGYPLMAIGSALAYIGAPLADWMGSLGIHPLLISLVTEALVTGLAFTIMMCGYIFGATLVFGLIEDVGYMARISYVFDNTMQKLGLHGKAMMPFLVSFGCNIAGSSGSRVLDTWGQRMTAIAMSWVVPCGSTWGVVGLVSTVFFGPGAALVIAALFAVSVLHLKLTASIYGKRLLSDADQTGLLMELPPYHKPHWRALFKTALIRMGEAFKRAIGIVTLIAIVLCLLSYSSSGNASSSILYRFGNAIEPVTMIFGLRWQTFLAWMASWMGKEGSLGALASVFSGGSVMTAVANMTIAPADSSSVAAALTSAITKPEALAFIFAFYFNMPCVMALSSAAHETHSLKWPLRIALYYIATSLILAGIVYHLALLFW